MRTYYKKSGGGEAFYYREGFVEIEEPIKEDGTIRKNHKNLHLVADITQKYHNLTIDTTSGLYEPDTDKNTTEYIQNVKTFFTNYTDEYIMTRIKEYNASNNTDFSGADSFAKYVVMPTSSRYAISMQFIVWIDSLWDVVRAITVEPTETEFKAILDAVAF